MSSQLNKFIVLKLRKFIGSWISKSASDEYLKAAGMDEWN